MHAKPQLKIEDDRCIRCGRRIEKGESSCPPLALDRSHDKCPRDGAALLGKRGE